MQSTTRFRSRLVGAILMLVTMLALAVSGPGLNMLAAQPKPADTTNSVSKPAEQVMKKAGSFNGDLSKLPYVTAEKLKKERPERGLSRANPLIGGDAAPIGSGLAPEATLAAMPTPSASFEGLDYATWGAGHPPDTTGDVGPTYFIQGVNTSVGIYNKSTGARVAAFTFDTFMSQGNFGNLCDTDNFGDPVILYDTFEDRWVVTDFAFQLDGSNNVINPPGAFQCFAVSKTGDPVNGGWNYYWINVAGGLGDYEKLGIWPDGLYMSANVFDYAASGGFQNVRVWAFNKFQMYAGLSSVQVVSFDAPAGEFTMLPANARLQAGAPPVGAPNYFAVVWQYLNVVSIYKFHVDWDRISTSTFTGPFNSVAPANWASAPSSVATNGGTNIDTLQPRLMIQNQYTNIGGVESVWDSHTVRGSTTTQAAVRWYQVAVTGGTVGSTTTQASTWNPDTQNRFMPSLAVDRNGNMAIGYSVASSSLKPAIRYAGRLASDPASTLGQTETSLIEGTGTQNTASYTRWGDYSTMTLDPNGCTFWYTQEYYQVTGTNDNTRIGAFKFPSCTNVGSGGTVAGTVTAAVGGAPISGAVVTFGSRVAVTNGSGQYSFTGIPAGTYPSISVSATAYNSASATPVAVSDSTTTTKDFALTSAPTAGCPVDTAQADFQLGVPTNTDLTTSPGNVTLTKPTSINQQNTTLSGSGYNVTTAQWVGQSFVPSTTGTMPKLDVNLFCGSCTGTTPNVTVDVRTTSGGLPTSTVLASATITGFSSGSSSYYTANFASPPTLTAGITYALMVRVATNPSAGSYDATSSGTNSYASGSIVYTTNGGTSWGSLTTEDLGFKIYIASGYTTSGTLLSGIKDANPASNAVPTWSTLSWTATTPASTAVKFQIGASNSYTGTFNLVGPDGTAATYFTTSGASLSQFNGFRYLKYQAYLTTSNTANTPTLNDVTICYTNAVFTPTATATATITNTPVPPTATSTVTLTPIPPTATSTATQTPVPPTATSTVTLTPVPPTATSTVTLTPVPPTATSTVTLTPVPPTVTATITNTPVPPTATATITNTPVPPTATATATATNTSVPFTATVTATATPTVPGLPVQSVTWIHKVYASASGNTLTKTGTNNAWDGGGISNRAINSGAGYVEASVNSSTGDLMLGLGQGDSNQSYTDIEYAIWVESGRAYVVEAGTYRGPLGLVANGDLLRVSVNAGVVSYAINGSVLYTSSVPAGYPLVFDTSLVGTGDSVVNAQVAGTDLVVIPEWPQIPVLPTEAVIWTNPVNVSVSGNSISKTGTVHAWDAGAASSRAIQSGDGYAQFTIAAQSGDVMMGLSNGDSGQGYWDIDYALWTESNYLYVVEGGVYKASVGPGYPGDIITVVVQSGTVSYFRNGNLLYTSSTPAVYPLGVDTSMVNTGDTVSNAVLGGTSLAVATKPNLATRSDMPAWPARPLGTNAPRLATEISSIRFNDVSAGAPYAAAVAWAANRGLVHGYSNSTGSVQFSPNAAMTRGTLVALVAQAAHLPAGSNKPVFADVTPKDSFYAAAQALAARGVLSGYACGGANEPCNAAKQPYLRPNAAVTREALLKLVLSVGRPPQSGAYTGFADVASRSALAPFVAEAQSLGWTAANSATTPSFSAGKVATRGEAIELLYRVFGGVR